MSAERLREAARLMRERAEAATGEWHPREDWYALHEIRHAIRGTSTDAEADAVYMHTMHPGVALEIAAFLDFAAVYGDQPEPQSPTVQFAVSIADAYLGSAR